MGRWAFALRNPEQVLHNLETLTKAEDILIEYTAQSKNYFYISETSAGNVKYSWSINYLLLLHEGNFINQAFLLLYNIVRFIGQIFIILLLARDFVWRGKLVFGGKVQGDPAGLGLDFGCSNQCLLDSTWADERWAERAEHLGKMSGTSKSKSTQIRSDT